MIELLERRDPAASVEVDTQRIRALTDERLGINPRVTSLRSGRRQWLFVAVGAAAALAIALPAILSRTESVSNLAFEQSTLDIPGVVDVVELGVGGGVQTMAVDGDVIWVASANSRQLHQLDVNSAEIVMRYPIDGHVEGLEVGGGYVWLFSYDNGGEVLRFDPGSGRVDATVVLGLDTPESVVDSMWIADSLWLSARGSDGAFVIHQIDPTGDLTVHDPDPSLPVVVSETGFLFTVSRELSSVQGLDLRSPLDSGNHAWFLDVDAGTLIKVHDAGFTDTVEVGRNPHSSVLHEGSVWVTSHDDYTLTRVDANTLEVLSVTPLPGRPGSLVVADGSIWVGLHQAGSIVRVDPSADLPEPQSADVDALFGSIHLRCVGSGDGPTVILDPDLGLGAGSWSVIQDSLSDQARVCSYDPRGTYSSTGSEGDSIIRSQDLSEALGAAGIDGPFVLVAHGHGVFSTRLFADARPDDVAGIVLIDPIPPGYTEYSNSLMPDVALDPDDSDLMEGLDDLGAIPLVVVGHDPEATFLHSGFLGNPGATPEIAESMNAFWQEGLDFYAGLSSDSRLVIADGSNHVIIWNRPEVVVEAVISLLGE